MILGVPDYRHLGYRFGSNLVRQVEMLKQLGLRTSKSLPQNLLDSAAVEEEGLALAAEAESSESVF